MERLSQSEEVAYFDSEPIASQIRAAVCVQSRVIEDRKVLLESSQQLLDKVKMSGVEIVKPDHYSGHRLLPTSIEFYKGSRDTINDRVRFRLVEDPYPIDLPSGSFHGSNGWVYERLEP
ncbi:unnamed protein product [Allacma fusca]|uniref:Pyridoxine 5'-phosphate oxidase dimerisation C-terminal domain-containing protein n=1 Tax=Allacma fusca TaxID=39272 RepID=A0A8J2L6V7_9HEXA|nr:unnamed protein product [Allacma fusca]